MNVCRVNIIVFLRMCVHDYTVCLNNVLTIVYWLTLVDLNTLIWWFKVLFLSAPCRLFSQIYM